MLDIKKIRTKEGLTQKEFAEKLGIERSQISNLESGTRPPSIKVIKKIKEVFPSEFDENAISEPSVSYGVDYKSKYFELLEQYKIISDKLTNCLESKIK